MIYNQNVFSKEKKQAYIEKHESRKSLIWHGILIALCTFAGHFMLQTLVRSVLMSVMSEYMMPSYFSVLSLYSVLAYVMYTGYIAKYYNYLTFAEISQNRWYTLVKFGYHPTVLIFVKMMTRILEILLLYSIGFGITIFLTLFLKYPFVPGYMFPLYIVGIIDIVFVTIVTMSCSLFIKEQKSARYIIVITAICIWFLRLASGYYTIVITRADMSELSIFYRIFTSSYFLYFVISLIISCIFIFIRARNIAQYTSFSFYIKDMDMDEEVRIVQLDEDNSNEVKETIFIKKSHNKIIDRAVNIIFTLLISVGILINVFVLFVSLSSPERETNFFGVIPFVFHTASMEPEIMYNDLAFFSTTDDEHGYQIGDIVLYRDGYEPVVSKVTEIENDNLKVDILSYQDGVEEGRYEKRITKETVYGFYIGRSRWLGMIILFANTVLGRLLLLLLPVGIFYYYKPVIAYLKKKGFLID